MIAREKEMGRLGSLLKHHPVVGIIGARQVGKTTLARAYINTVQTTYSFFDLENPEDMARMQDPMLALKGLRGIVVIDEIQRYPDLFPVLRVLADRPGTPARFIVLGSASPALLRQGAETLAGRIYYHELGGFAIDEVGVDNLSRLWLRGGFPKSYLSASNSDSYEWRQAFIRTFLERDMPQLGITIRSSTLRRFWTMLANYHGQTWNASEFGRSFGVADTTVRNYLDLLSSAMVVRQLMPWYENISKRQVKAPKVYISDSGILHSLLGQRSIHDLEAHPKLGASWEGYIIEQVIRRLGVSSDEAYFWATHGGAELDLLIIRGKERLGFEIKRTSSPRVTPSMKISITNLKLKKLYIIHSGDETFQLDRKIDAVSASRLLQDIKPLK